MIEASISRTWQSSLQNACTCLGTFLMIPRLLQHASTIYKCVFLDVRCDETLWSTLYLIRGHVKFAGQLSTVPSPLRHSEYEPSLVSGTCHEFQATPANLKSTLSQHLCGLKQAISASPLKTAVAMETQCLHRPHPQLKLSAIIPCTVQDCIDATIA